MTETHTNPKAESIRAAMGVARTAADANLDTDTLGLLTAGLAVDQRIADGDLTPDALDREVAEGIVRVFGDVRRDGPLWSQHLQVFEEVLRILSEDERAAAWRRTAWCDADDHPALAAPAEAEPWDEPAPELSEPETHEQPSPAVDVPPPPEPDESGDKEIIEAEIVEVEQVTSSQRRYRAPVGTFGPPGVTNPALARSISGRRQPIIEIGGEAAGWG
ncbi:hypothetical protein QSJ19_19730 [Gordonia sp. ABSL11-1]|uniref:hypothetical protein n=1 Tax=Gordonia sp. ABSL11-1 TaxID=3053924 RepID=UPI00257224D8|nr:hypothetical protein [Gordonia sp. ABSL11-1]MDL9947768.1 hypothetical protein [Gordonia sp. ABSL11-1]